LETCQLCNAEPCACGKAKDVGAAVAALPGDAGATLRELEESLSNLPPGKLVPVLDVPPCAIDIDGTLLLCGVRWRPEQWLPLAEFLAAIAAIHRAKVSE
jgi:hypothetical protein